jgi:hypothetical protein
MVKPLHWFDVKKNQTSISKGGVVIFGTPAFWLMRIACVSGSDFDKYSQLPAKPSGSFTVNLAKL